MIDAYKPVGARFHPRALRPSAEVVWALLRAFSPRDRPSPAVAPERALEVARRLDLLPRIAARTPQAQLRAELSESLARRLQAAHGVAALAVERVTSAAREVAATAAEGGTPLAFLKGAALHLAGVTAVGSRFMGDLDVLVPAEHAEGLQRAMRAAGYRPCTSHATGDHELPKLVSPQGVFLDVHRHLPGVRLGPGSPPATFGGLRDAGLLEPVDGWKAWVPTCELLAAHALAHTLAQHAFEPRSHPATRLLADLADLGFGSDQEPDAGAVLPLVQDDAPEAGAALRLVRQLASGAALASLPGPEASLLAHLLGGLLDDDYAEALKLRALFAGPSRDVGALLSAVGRAAFLGRAEAEALYGPGRSGTRRWLRPFELAWKVARALRADLALRAERLLG